MTKPTIEPEMSGVPPDRGAGRALGSPHQHDWQLPDGDVLVIDTYPPQYPYTCECGAFTHDPETGAPCQMCNPEDYARRGPTIRLKDGPFDGQSIARPVNQSVYLRMDDGRVQKNAKYQQTESDRDVWEFGGYVWTNPFEPREDSGV